MKLEGVPARAGAAHRKVSSTDTECMSETM